MISCPSPIGPCRTGSYEGMVPTTGTRGRHREKRPHPVMGKLPTEWTVSRIWDHTDRHRKREEWGRRVWETSVKTRDWDGRLSMVRSTEVTGYPPRVTSVAC